ncbi:unnamed protein product [Blepharisma stoltei]|uniref:ubiquitinyl hydrolase 1 n=1 Tax=Blepharisma stoltei TaxID=1481888 RepID=A0AAU9INQ9_9CILI|nr:unnamed protein product [Blepharisma stoltei]
MSVSCTLSNPKRSGNNRGRSTSKVSMEIMHAKKRSLTRSSNIKKQLKTQNKEISQSEVKIKDQKKSRAKAHAGDTAIDEPNDEVFKTLKNSEKSENPNIKFWIKIDPCDFSLNFLELPETVNPYWLLIEDMKKILSFSEIFVRNVNALIEYNFVGWKKCLGDGNCYYRAVMHCYLWNIFNVSTNLQCSTSLLNFIEQINFLPKGFEEKKAKFMVIINYLRRIKARNPIQAFVEFNKFTQDEEFDNLAFCIGRLIAAKALWEKQNDPLFQPFLYNDINIFIEKILTIGEWAEDLDLLALPIGLNIQVKIYGFFNDALSVTLYPEEYKSDENGIPPISIVRRGGHYDILYSKEECDRDRYDFETHTYHFEIEKNNFLQKYWKTQKRDKL